MPAPRTVLLTGAAGGLGTLIRELLPGHGYELRLLDLRPGRGRAGRDRRRPRRPGRPARGGPGRRRDHPPRGHLPGSLFREDPQGQHRGHVQPVYEAAREEGVGRVVFASSNHAVGYTPRPQGDDPLVPVDTPRRPDTFYGLSKCFGEDLAQLYWDKRGIETVSVRIGSCSEPTSVRMLSVWMSPADGARLFHAALTAENVGHTVVHGSSANTRLWWDLTSARALGYEPRDDSEPYADKLVAEEGLEMPGHPTWTQVALLAEKLDGSEPGMKGICRGRPAGAS
ncbi:NAD(P)-dependent oxidoreductase [Streptomyces violaceorubidus]